MLARVAESLYWIGRNIERAEHCSRFLKVQYFSTLDTPMARNRDFTLRSIVFTAGADISMKDKLIEKEVWHSVIFDINNPNSIFSIIKNARENARSIRNSISIEIWESINKWYLSCNKYNENNFSSNKIYAFYEDMLSQNAMIKSNIANTILHNDIYHFISLGVYIERALQVLSIVRNKVTDWVILSDNGVNKALMSYQWTILLKSIEAFDVHNHLYKGQKNKANIFELIFENPIFTRSITYTLEKIKYCISRISVKPQGLEELFYMFEHELKDLTKPHDYENEDEIVKHIDEAFERISKIHFSINNIYFN